MKGINGHFKVPLQQMHLFMGHLEVISVNFFFKDLLSKPSSKLSKATCKSKGDIMC